MAVNQQCQGVRSAVLATPHSGLRIVRAAFTAKRAELPHENSRAEVYQMDKAERDLPTGGQYFQTCLPGSGGYSQK